MNITIVGHGHLAYITAACMEQFHKVNVDETDIEKLQASQIVWICYDTPVDADGKPSSQVVVDRLRNILPNAGEGTIVLVSSQIPVGTSRTCLCISKVDHCLFSRKSSSRQSNQ